MDSQISFLLLTHPQAAQVPTAHFFLSSQDRLLCFQCESGQRLLPVRKQNQTPKLLVAMHMNICRLTQTQILSIFPNVDKKNNSTEVV